MKINWKKVSEFEENFYLRMAFAFADDNQKSKLQKGFPECFTEEDSGPIKWSLLQALMDEKHRTSNDKSLGKYVNHMNAIWDLGLPYIYLGDKESADEYEENPEEWRIVPENDPAWQLPIGGSYIDRVSGSEFVVVAKTTGVADSRKEIMLVPKPVIDLDS